MRVLAIIILIIGASVFCASAEENLHGYAALYHPNGRVWIEGTFDNGRLSGKWTEYYENGQIRRTGAAYGSVHGPNRLEDPLKTGPWVEYNPNGTLRFEGTYFDDLLAGRAAQYENGRLKYEGTFEDGRLTGTWTEYWTNIWGDRIRETGQADGSALGLNSLEEPVRVGRWTRFYIDGSVEFEGTYENNLLEGPAVKYFYGTRFGLSSSSGAKEIEGTFVEGHLKGVWIRYHRDGSIHQIGEAYGSASVNSIDEPLKTGPWLEYSSNGTLEFEGVYEDDRLVHARLYRWYDGALEREATFIDGRAVTWTEYDAAGQIREIGRVNGTHRGEINDIRDFPVKHGPWFVYDPDGSLSFEGTYENDRLAGRAAMYWDGRRTYEATFKDGLLAGPWTSYYPNGMVALTGEAYGQSLNSFQGFLKEGRWVEYAQDGMILFEGTYVNDLLHGYAAGYIPGSGRLAWEGEFEYGYPVGFVRVYGPDGHLRETGELFVTRPIRLILGCCVMWSVENKTGLWLTFRDDGSLARSDYYERGRPARPVSPVNDPHTGLDRYAVMNADGSRAVYDAGPGGIASVRRDPLPGPLPFDLDEIADYTYDPDTGELRIVRKSPDGSLVAWTGRRYTDGEGNERISETDEFGNRRETVISPDGSTRVTVTGPDGEESTVALDPVDGLAVTETLPDGSSLRTTYDPWKDAIITERLDAEGLPLGIVIQRPDGWIDEIDESGNLRTWRRNPDGSTTVVELDRTGNVVATRVDSAGDPIELERVLAAPRGPDESRGMTPEERLRAIEESRERARELQRQYDAAVARGDMEEARRIMALQDEHEAASMDLLMPTEEEMREMERLSEIRSRLMTEINEAAFRRAQLDLFVAERAQDRKDSVTSKTQLFLVGSQMQQETSNTTRAAERERILARAKVEEIDSRLQRGGLTAEEREILLEAREIVVLQESGATELLAANGRITAAGYLIDGITTVTGAGVVTAAGRAGMRAVTGAAARLGSETVVTAAESAAARVAALASADVLTPAVSAMGSAVRRVVGDAVSDAASSAASRLWQAGQADVGDLGSKLLEAVRRTPEPAPGTGALAPAGAPPAPLYRTPAERASTVLENAPAANAAARSERLKMPSEMTPAERQAYHDRLWDDFWGRMRRGEIDPDYADDWDDVLVPIGSNNAVSARPFTREELARLHEPGRELTTSELMRKAEIYRARHEAAYLAETAGTPAERIAYADRLRRINSFLDEYAPWDLRPGARERFVTAPTVRMPAPELPDWMTAETWIMEPSLPRYSRPSAGRTTEIFEPVDFPPLREEAVPPASFTPPPPPPPPLSPPPPPPPMPPLKTGVSPERPTIEWPVGPYIHGLPGPGIGPQHIEAARRLANETGVPVVIHGSRQTGFSYHTGRVWRIDTDLDLGAVGPPEALSKLLRYEPEKKAWVPDILHPPMYRWETIADALRQGLLVVSPEP